MMIEDGREIPFHEMFGIFDYAVMETDSAKVSLLFHNCELLKNMFYGGGGGGELFLAKGNKYNSVIFNLERQTFHFVNWKNGQFCMPYETSVIITQIEFMRNLFR